MHFRECNANTDNTRHSQSQAGYCAFHSNAQEKLFDEKEKQPTFWSHLQIPNVISWSMNSIQFYTTYERINDKAYRGILAVVKNKNQGHKLNS